jgi:hypothetical protein
MKPNRPGDSLATTASALAGNDAQGRAVQELIRLAEGRRSTLEQARGELCGRIRLRSDDYAATSGLTLLNAALAEIGWPATITWEPRRGRRIGR